MRLIAIALLVGSLGQPFAKANDTEYSGLWAGPGFQSEEHLRERLPLFSPTSVTTAYWTTPKGRVNASRVIDSITSYMVKIGLFDRWPKGGMGFNDIPSRCIAPYHFFVISIRPTVVVMALRIDGDSEYGFGPRPARKTRATTTKYFENIFEYGSEIVDRPKLMWFSPDLAVSPCDVEVDRAQSTFRIDHEKFQIRATLSNGIWKTERLK